VKGVEGITLTLAVEGKRHRGGKGRKEKKM